MALRKTPQADIKKRYPIYVQVGMVAALALVIAAFTVPYQPGSDFEIVEVEQEIVEVEEIEQTQQIQRPPPPPAPPPPMEVPDEQIIEDEVIDLDMDMDLEATPPAPPPPPPPPAPTQNAPPPPPPEPEPEPEIFVIVEQQPVLIGGLEGLQRNIQYPEMARRAGIEGKVFLQFVVNEDGSVTDIQCLRDPGGGTCDAAKAAMRQARFQPGQQRGRPVKVRFSLPVTFKLN